MPSTESPNPGAAVVPALVSIFNSEVTSLGCVTIRPLGYVPRSSGHTFPTKLVRIASLTSRRISQYETRSSRYRSQTEVRSLAPSLQSLTGKPSLTYSIGPFVVELFTAERLTRSPKRSDFGAAGHPTTAPHASRVERTRFAETSQAQNPTDGIWNATATWLRLPSPAL